MTMMIRRMQAGLPVALQSGTTAQRPAPTYVNQTYFDTDIGYQIAARSVAPAVWVDHAGMPV